MIIGGGGNDQLAGEAGNDTFVFEPGFGADVIADFQDGAEAEDLIEFSASVFADFAAVQAASRQIGADVVITASATDAVTLSNVTLSSLSAEDFRFA